MHVFNKQRDIFLLPIQPLKKGVNEKVIAKFQPKNLYSRTQLCHRETMTLTETTVSGGVSRSALIETSNTCTCVYAYVNPSLFM